MGKVKKLTKADLIGERMLNTCDAHSNSHRMGVSAELAHSCLEISETVEVRRKMHANNGMAIYQNANNAAQKRCKHCLRCDKAGENTWIKNGNAEYAFI